MIATCKSHRSPPIFFLTMLSMLVNGCSAAGGLPTSNQSAAPPPQSWMGITPGETTREDTISILGEPTSREIRENHEILIYSRKEEFDWAVVEIWITEEVPSDLVIGVFRNYSIDNQNNYLADLIRQLGKPNRVTWSMYRGARYVIWSELGMSIRADAEVSVRDWQELQYGEVLIFEPQEIQRYFEYDWPWPSVNGFSLKNLYSDSPHAPDNLPENPYDWNEIIELEKY